MDNAGKPVDLSMRDGRYRVIWLIYIRMVLFLEAPEKMRERSTLDRAVAEYMRKNMENHTEMDVLVALYRVTRKDPSLWQKAL